MLLQATVVSVSCIAPKHEQHDAYMHCTTVTIGSSESKMMGSQHTCLPCRQQQRLYALLVLFFHTCIFLFSIHGASNSLVSGHARLHGGSRPTDDMSGSAAFLIGVAR